MNLLFVCKHNKFRSKVAESYFKKINKNKDIHVDSAGLIRGNLIEKNTMAAARVLEIIIKNPPHGLSSKLLEKQDIVVIVANNVPSYIFKGKVHGKIIHWKIQDCPSEEKEKIKVLIKQIMKKVDKLVEKLKNAK